MPRTIVGVVDPKAIKKYSALLAVDTSRKSDFNKNPASFEQLNIAVDRRGATKQHSHDVLLRVKQITLSKGNLNPLIPVSRAAFWDGVKKGKYPPPDIRLGARTVCWRMSTIQSVIDGTWKPRDGG